MPDPDGTLSGGEGCGVVRALEGPYPMRLWAACLPGDVLHAQALGRVQDDMGRRMCLSERDQSRAIPASCDVAASLRSTQAVWTITQTCTHHAPRVASDLIEALNRSDFRYCLF